MELEWVSRANCKGFDIKIFYPEKGQPQYVEVAKKVCANCDVQSECLEYGINEHHGIWGGTTENDRRNLRRRRHRAVKNPLHRNDFSACRDLTESATDGNIESSAQQLNSRATEPDRATVALPITLTRKATG